MRMEVFNDHRKLFGAALLLFVVLSFFVAILPAVNNQNNNAPLPGSEVLSGDALAGKDVFISNGCVACHSQQVRNVDMDKSWGSRPGIAADYANNVRVNWWMNTATLMGTERTGPDLTDIGNRLPSADWHLIHLYNPRAVVENSIMPAYPWLFEWKNEPVEGEKVVNVPETFAVGKNGKLVASKDALLLVAYLQSLKQTPLPDGVPSPDFLYKSDEQQVDKNAGEALSLEGAELYAANCQACHQTNGEGMKGAFPPLKSSPIVLDENPEALIEIIMKGYNAREEYGAMPAIGSNNELTPEEIAAIINHERTSWGNNARVISIDEVEKILHYLEESKTSL
jgi:cytochrome c oxidase cbb3-type subunit II